MCLSCVSLPSSKLNKPVSFNCPSRDHSDRSPQYRRINIPFRVSALPTHEEGRVPYLCIYFFYFFKEVPDFGFTLIKFHQVWMEPMIPDGPNLLNPLFYHSTKYLHHQHPTHPQMGIGRSSLPTSYEEGTHAFTCISLWALP